MDTDTIKIEAAHARNDDPATLIESIDNTAKMDDGEEDAVSVHADEADETDDQQIILLRDPNERPVFKLSVKLLDTYKYINKVYYESKARRLREQKESSRGGVHNDGFDDQNYDYILQGDEILKDRYILKHRMGKGSFGQVVCAYDQENKCEVAIKIIKSRKPFMMQARTEIDILMKIQEKDPNDERHVVRLLDQFIHRNHQCIVFEILSFNLYELLRNTRFRGVSLNLIRKFAIQLLRALELLSRPEVNIIHCDLKPENIVSLSFLCREYSRMLLFQLI
jgi:dual specificity tyrosine-phosphorylation-regulated kinase 1